MATGKTRLSEEDLEAIKACGGIGEEYDQIPDDIAIVGTGPTMRCLPKDNPYEVWGCNGAAWDVECDRVFIMDGMAACRKTSAEFARYMEHVRVPIYLPDRDPAIPASIGFGTNEALWSNIFREFGVPWVGSTIGYMLAFAIYRKVKRIHFYGCDFLVKGFNDNEYSEQGPAMCLWTGIAIGRGVQCLFPAEMVMAMPLRYGQHPGVTGTVKSDGTFTDENGKKWVDYERVSKRLGHLTVEEDRPAGTHIGVGVEREYLGARPVEEV